jgi:hypothetical protein
VADDQLVGGGCWEHLSGHLPGHGESSNSSPIDDRKWLGHGIGVAHRTAGPAAAGLSTSTRAAARAGVRGEYTIFR